MSIYRDKAEGFSKGQKGDRAAFITDVYLDFLDDLRASGECNMFGARQYLENEFPELTPKTASEILGYWMKTFPRE